MIRRLLLVLGFGVVAVIAASWATLPAAVETVQLEREHGVYMLPVRINNVVVIPFIVDSGAAEMVIPLDVFQTLVRTGTISPDDFTGTGTYTPAAGSTTLSKRYVLHKMAVRNHVLTNVVANVAPVQADPLLGQSLLEQLPAWAIDNSRHASF